MSNEMRQETDVSFRIQRPAILSDENIPPELVKLFVNYFDLEISVEAKRKLIVNSIVDYLLNMGVSEFQPSSPWCQTMFLLYVKRLRSHSTFLLEANRIRFPSVYEMELEFPNLTRAGSRALVRYSKRSK